MTPFGRRGPVWRYNSGFNKTSKDKFAFEHPALMPEQMAEDLILSFSRPGELVFDPMCGSGTTLKMAILNHRKFLGFEIHEPYVAIARRTGAACKKGAATSARRGMAAKPSQLVQSESSGASDYPAGGQWVRSPANVNSNQEREDRMNRMFYLSVHLIANKGDPNGQNTEISS